MEGYLKLCRFAFLPCFILSLYNAIHCSLAIELLSSAALLSHGTQRQASMNSRTM